MDTEENTTWKSGRFDPNAASRASTAPVLAVKCALTAASVRCWMGSKCSAEDTPAACTTPVISPNRCLVSATTLAIAAGSAASAASASTSAPAMVSVSPSGRPRRPVSTNRGWRAVRARCAATCRPTRPSPPVIRYTPWSGQRTGWPGGGAGT